MSSSKYLKSRDLKIIRAWINRVKRKNEKPKKSHKKQARKRVKKQLRYKEVGCGKKRLVLDLGKRSVLKIAISVNGIKDIEREVEMYRKAPNKLKRNLAKVRESGKGWLVMKKMKRKVAKTKRTKVKARRLRKRFERSGISAGDLFSKKSKRVRWANIRRGRKRKIVVIDYGNFKFKR
ncbi:hypothetical protein BEP19_00970 [Ammoniphilus oxalaticus]|uniref:Uncharacterized protein n=1 Tax=Ammoniphilus oxalaticus TaxID=66863 RepID=A0A419SMM7_9BACL|nr:hypothetical protein [Ammoniphilus oxalaticus]RKD25547.1 hypothetical protein BEP19_00970 [Ammoniphilus oxalaticus]